VLVNGQSLAGLDWSRCSRVRKRHPDYSLTQARQPQSCQRCWLSGYVIRHSWLPVSRSPGRCLHSQGLKQPARQIMIRPSTGPAHHTAPTTGLPTCLPPAPRRSSVAVGTSPACCSVAPSSSYSLAGKADLIS
jgi:hypothetical protein